MKNGEAVGNRTQSEAKTEWDDLGASVPFNKEAAENNRRLHNSNSQSQEISYDAGNLDVKSHDPFNQETSSGKIDYRNFESSSEKEVFYDGGNLDAKSERIPDYDTESYRSAKERPKSLTWAERVEASRVRAEEGILSQGQERAQTVDEVERARAERANENAGQRWQNEHELEVARRASMTPYEKAEEKADALIRNNPLAKDVAEGVYLGEHAKIAQLLAKVERIDKQGNKKQSFIDKFIGRRDRSRAVKELQRYGYQAGNNLGENSTVFNELSKEHPFGQEKVGQNRYRDFYLIRSIQTTVDKKQLRRIKNALGERGFKTLPKSWDDKDFTSHEISTIEQIMQTFSDTQQ